jgi:uncharacterized protein (DUF302 family)
MRLSRLLLVVMLACQWPALSRADGLVMVRTSLKFPEAMLALQDSISEHGYTVSRVQRVDVGLTGMGYETDMYRIVFAGKYEEIREICDKVPELLAYMPPKISIFAEGNQTILVTAHPSLYAGIAGDRLDPVIFDRWASDLESILHDVRTAQ